MKFSVSAPHCQSGRVGGGYASPAGSPSDGKRPKAFIKHVKPLRSMATRAQATWQARLTIDLTGGLLVIPIPLFADNLQLHDHDDK